VRISINRIGRKKKAKNNFKKNILKARANIDSVLQDSCPRAGWSLLRGCLRGPVRVVRGDGVPGHAGLPGGCCAGSRALPRRPRSGGRPAWSSTAFRWGGDRTCRTPEPGGYLPRVGRAEPCCLPGWLPCGRPRGWLCPLGASRCFASAAVGYPEGPWLPRLQAGGGAWRHVCHQWEEQTPVLHNFCL